MKAYIKNLEFKIVKNYQGKTLIVNYVRNGEHNKYALKNVPEWVKDEKSVRKYINN